MRLVERISMVSGVVSLALIAGGSAAMAQSAKGRQSMEQCVQTQLTSLARAQTPEQQVGAVVVAKCDGPLKATLAEAIRTGEAGGCTVQSCLAIAKERASAEAAQAYRQMITR